MAAGQPTTNDRFILPLGYFLSGSVVGEWNHHTSPGGPAHDTQGNRLH
jgi:hypothetical protein